MLQKIISLIQNNNLAEARTLCNQLRLKNKKNTDILVMLADIDNRMGDVKNAEKFYRKAIRLKPNSVPANTKLGIMFHSQNRLAQAESSYRQSLKFDIEQPSVCFNLAIILQEKELLDDAAQFYRKAIEFNPSYAKAYSNLAYIYRKKNRLDDAASNYLKAIEHAPGIAEIHYNFGITLLHQNKLKDAEFQQRRALEIKPGYADAWCSLGMVQFTYGKLEDSIISYKNSLAINSEHEDALNGCAAVFSKLNMFDESIELFNKSLLINPENENTMIGLGIAYQGINNYSMALSTYRKVVMKSPGHVESHIGMASVYMSQGEYEEAIKLYQKAIDIQPEHYTAYSDLLMLLNYCESLSPSYIYDEHVNWATKYSLNTPKLEYSNIPDPGRKIRIAYISPDLRVHVVTNFFYPILKCHDTNKFEIYCYADVAHEDSWSQLLKAEKTHWTNIYRMSDAELIDQIQADKIDILVDLAGHTKGNRLVALTAKPAPIQMTYLGYPNTTGLSTIDYRLTDEWADPVGESDKYYTENLIRLNNGFLCYSSINKMPNEVTLPALKNGYITFGSFNNLTKITECVVKIWAAILNKLPTSRLVLKNRSFSSQQVYERYLNLFSSHGVEADRVQLCGPTKTYEDHLKAYNQIDIALDTFPYNGTTTTCEALMMSVPVITLAGNMHAGRVGVSLMSQVNLTDYIAQTQEEYIKLALKKANDVEGLGKLRNLLRNQVSTSFLSNGKAFTQDIEEVYRQVWSNWCNN